jgi:uncharacterized heparinase superfamily protein
MKPAELARVWRTVRHLRREQVAGQLRRRLRGPAAPLAIPADPPLRGLRARTAFLPAPAHARFTPPARVRLLNREVDFRERVDWSFAAEGPLWSYHLHQFDWLRGPELAAASRTGLVLDWIAAGEGGPGWDPHPTSLRLFAWTKLLLTPGALRCSADEEARVRASLARQAATLAANLETHLLANHYLSNLLAVALAAVLFEGALARELQRRARPLVSELAEQIRPDGAHCERSPMYHSLLLENVLDLLNVGVDALDAVLADALREAASRMLGALRVWTHPDGEIALFADAAFGIAQPPGALERYAAALGVAPSGPARPGALEAVGYARLEQAPFTLIASLAGPMPAHQPGHAHCDALAFELSVAGERVVTDTGVFEYVPGPRRDLARSTRAHATLEVDGREQAELWAAHRVGGRPEVRWIDLVPGRRVAGSCAGWSTPDTRHRRVFEVQDGILEIRDALEGSQRRVRFALPLAPDLGVALEGGRAHLRLRGGLGLEIALPAGVSWRVAEAPYYPEFGRSLERPVLVGDADSFRAGTWRFRVQT